MLRDRWPAAMPLHEAAAYSGISVDTFKKKCPVRPIKFTKSTRGDRYLRVALDNWLEQIWLEQIDQNGQAPAPKPRKSWGERIGGKSAPARA